MSKENFYVYLLYREDGTPFYCGKGFGSRWTSHERNARKSLPVVGENIHKRSIIRIMLSAGISNIPKVKIASGLTNAKAITLEMETIAQLGRHPNGPLVNLTDGGEGSIGRVQLDEERKKRSVKLTEVWASPDVRLQMSALQRQGFINNPDRAKKISVALRAAAETPEWVAMNASTRQRAIAVNTGRKCSDDSRARMSVSQMERTVESRARTSAARWTTEHKIAQTDRMLGYAADPKWQADNGIHIAKLAEMNRGRKWTPEHRSRVAEARAAAAADPEREAARLAHITKLANASRGKRRTDDERERISIGIRAARARRSQLLVS